MAKKRSRRMHDELSERVTRTETNIETLSHDVKALTDTVGDLGRDFRVAIDDLTKTQHEQNKPNYGLLVACLAVCLTLIGMLAAFYDRDLARLEERVGTNGIAILTNYENAPTQREIDLQNEINRVEREKLQIQVDFIMK